MESASYFTNYFLEEEVKDRVKEYGDDFDVQVGGWHQSRHDLQAEKRVAKSDDPMSSEPSALWSSFTEMNGHHGTNMA